MNPFLCTLDEMGRLKPFLGLPETSFSCPAITIERAEIRSLAAAGDGGLRADLSVWGRVEGERYEYLTDRGGEPESLRFYVNGADRPLVEVPVERLRELRQGWLRPFGYRGTFAFSLDGVEVTEGVNTFELRGGDPMTFFDSGATFVISVSAEYPDGDWGESGPADVRLDREPEVLHPSADGESVLYTIAVADVPAAQGSLTLCMPSGAGGTVPLPTAIDPVSGWHYPVVNGTTYPQMFSLHIGRRHDARSGPAPTKEGVFRQHPWTRSLADDARFRFGFRFGMAYSCLDLAFAVNSILGAAIHTDATSTRLQMPLGLQLGAGVVVRKAIAFPTAEDAGGFDAPPHFGLGEFLLYCMKLFQFGDPRKDELVLGLLTDDWEAMGLGGFEFRDCRAVLGSYGPEVLEQMLLSQVGKDPMEQGLFIGQGVSEMLRILRAGRERCGVGNYYSKADFLDALARGF